MAITIGATTIGSTAASGTSINIGSLTPDAGSDKRVIAVGFKHGTVSGSSDPMSATFGGNAMSKIAEVDDPTDPRRVLAVFEYDIGSSTTAGDVVFTCSVSDRWSGIAYVVIGVPVSATPLSNTSTALSALSVTFAAAGLLLDFAAVNTDDSATSDNVITIDGAQTLIRSQNRGVGLSTEGRLTASYKSATSGSQSGANTSPFADGVAHIVVGYEEAGGSSFTGTGSATLAALTGAATGTFYGAFTGTGAASLAALAASASGWITLTGTAGATLPALTGAATGTFAAAGNTTASGAATIPSLTSAATGTFFGLFTGTGAASLTALTAAGAGWVTVTGTGAGTIPSLTASATGTLVGGNPWSTQSPSVDIWSTQSEAAGAWSLQTAAAGTWTVQ